MSARTHQIKPMPTQSKLIAINDDKIAEGESIASSTDIDESIEVNIELGIN